MSGEGSFQPKFNPHYIPAEGVNIGKGQQRNNIDMLPTYEEMERKTKQLDRFYRNMRKII